MTGWDIGRARAAASTLLLGSMWVLLAGADPAAWVVGVPAVGLAVACATALPRRRAATVQLGAAARLLGAFVRDSIRGAIDVGARSVAAEPAIHAQVVSWRTSLRTPLARLVFFHAVNLVPGTLTARTEREELCIHLLDDRGPWRDELAALEARVAAAFEPVSEASR